MSLYAKYKKEIIPTMQKEFGLKNRFMIPVLDKVVVNIGLSKVLIDPKFMEIAENTLKKITGQKPVKTRAKKAISNFKIKKGMPIGMMVTLRGKRMYDFIEKLIYVTLPRVRDFRGIPLTSLDQSGNLSIGMQEHTVFPEIKADEIEHVHGLEVSLITKGKDKIKSQRLFEALGIPFAKNKKQ
ncbi:MAG: 50S ribosomal protein L5 [Candidatus Kerfeldbacteria bacterium RIFCSPHIGHO2_02_FULL_42_14]|uniref:Large ribosomal subunit protein uL5 n=1 Tax=Candidatus Kerfeldbacteria bacterium RIFCSPHIGHO2_02_FULL_42_14 TaxID=1798540 RepID=A0A1G2ARW3_9BACT|nr:MAG: 50S ribosomal protein L5 [Candidatus Kerfeldbacteria bacterium RIFCSPHIGHO2_02_FULL_42_14]OGY80416.1 MAG: 50S ribosomal protein L5 [Candidatus Kerfeldbacteria bacterium RIFCSPHIGHO2_12_FULL_42_13]OGY83846.1 MAG: 50S ribosomal protein L5 [Candidatus Kerfeldbacteria bacterium RIFCSPLOWO2_02_FULL_42_19]OGY85309.1 MAG: 50S ribosomal protein L5 [Candidatus Kerfeldbacteria bacterium RIFCSPLOWO2_12_FULL_43_9]